MDKITYYNFQDKSDKDNNIIIKISTVGFPVEERIEYDNKGELMEDINLVNIDPSFRDKIEKIIQDNNLMLILDLLRENDTYYNNEYNIEISVRSLEIQDNYA